MSNMGAMLFGGLHAARHELKSCSDRQSSKMLMRPASTESAVIETSRHPGALRARADERGGRAHQHPTAPQGGGRHLGHLDLARLTVLEDLLHTESFESRVSSFKLAPAELNAQRTQVELET